MYNEQLRNANESRKETTADIEDNFNAQLDGRGDGILAGHNLQLAAIIEAARRISGAEQHIWSQSKEVPYPIIRRVIMLLMHDDGYTDRQIARYLGCHRSNVTTQRHKCLREITGRLQDKIVVSYYNQFKKIL